jgi:hypothetical protein
MLNEDDMMTILQSMAFGKWFMLYTNVRVQQLARPSARRNIRAKGHTC